MQSGVWKEAAKICGPCEMEPLLRPRNKAKSNSGKQSNTEIGGMRLASAGTATYSF